MPPPSIQDKGLNLESPLTSEIAVSDLELIQSISGYGRELFFSNILDYIANHCPKAIATALKEHLPSEGFDHAKRENKHMDLVFFNQADKPVLVLENKRGSIATQKQLDKYKEQISKIREEKHNHNQRCSFLLISPQQFEKELAEKAGWAFMGYGELGKQLTEALHQIATDNLDYKHSFEYQLLERATSYMSALEAESTKVTESVTLETRCSKLNPEGGPIDHVKLRYCAVAKMLIQLLKENNMDEVDANFDSGTSSPLVNMEIKETKNTDNGKVNFCVQFQDGCLSVGFGREDKFDPLEKSQKKEKRRTEWFVNKYSDALTEITNEPGGFSNYNGTGYMTTDYILSMYRIDVKNLTVKEVLQKMVQYAKGALEYRDNQNHIN